MNHALNTGYDPNPAIAWLKAQFHCHCREPNGDWNTFGGPEKLVETYRSRGYDVVAITDHHGSNCLTNPVLSDPHVESVTFVRGLEDSSVPHMVVLGCEGMAQWISEFETLHGRMREYKEKGAVLIAAHPLGDGDLEWQQHDLLDARVQGLEVKDDPRYSELWTRVTCSRLDKGVPAPIGLCDDDAHVPADTNKAWSVVQARYGRDEAAIMRSIAEGAFYGVRCGHPQPADAVTPKFTWFDTPECLRARCGIQNATHASVITAAGVRTLSTAAGELEYEPSVADRFCRFEIMDDAGATAYSQPFVLCPTFDDRNARQVTNWVRALYRDVLRRPADEAGLEGTARALLLTNASLEGIAQGVVHSVEFCTRLTQDLYNTLLDRPPGSSEGAGWVNALASSMTQQEAIVGFLASAEYVGRYPGASEFVKSFYDRLIHRQPGGFELAAAVGLMTAGHVGRDEVVRRFLRGSEDYVRGQVRSLYERLLGRQPDEPAWTSWAAELKGGRDVRDLIVGFVTSDEYRARNA